MTRKRMYLSIGFMIIIMFHIFLYETQHSSAQDQSEIKNILVLNSYHQGLTWTKEEVEGVTTSLIESGFNISTSIEYMDWKNYPTDTNINYLYEYYKFKYQQKKIDLIITTDDAALKFALEKRREIFSDAPVIFCGVNQEGSQSITKGYDRVTGVVEVIDPTKSIQIALNINPDIKNLYLLYDNSESGLTTGQIVIEKISSAYPNLNIISCNQMIYEGIINTVERLNKDSIVMITTYYSDVNNRIKDMDFVNRDVSEKSKVPVYHLYDFGLNNGAIGGDMLSGRLQGEYAAGLALRVIEGEDPDTIPVITSETITSALDFQQMERFGITLKDVPKDIEIINKPFSFYETYKALVLGVLATIIVLISFISILLFYIIKIKRMKKNLAESHEELTQLYEELTASDEEMKQQYDEILDINEKLRLGDEKLSYLAYHDTLTGLPNKLSLYEDAKRMFNTENGKAVLLFIDIDNFKNVNDAMGHDFGDLLLKKVSERLTSLMDYDKAIYRLSGDEFILILKNIKDDKIAEEFATEILSRFSQEIVIQGSILHVSVSIGIAFYPEHGSVLEQLMKYADIAMYKAKETGRKNYMIYNDLMNEVFIERVNIEKYLYKALDNEEFELFYQPQLDLKTNKITGYEALLRWHSPELGNVSPIKFIKVAEDTRFIISLGTWVLQNACAFIKRLNKNYHTEYVISVNISIIQLLQTDFCDIVFETLQQQELEPRFLELEITESVLMESIEKIGIELKKLDEKNIKIALDDFGKGYSSLNYLRQLPISTLKVDKTFVDYIIDKNKNELTGQIVTLGKSMGMCVVAEGVEMQEQLDYLVQHDCDKIQGYLYCRPIPEADILRLLDRIN